MAITLCPEMYHVYKFIFDDASIIPSPDCAIDSTILFLRNLFLFIDNNKEDKDGPKVIQTQHNFFDLILLPGSDNVVVLKVYRCVTMDYPTIKSFLNINQTHLGPFAGINIINLKQTAVDTVLNEKDHNWIGVVKMLDFRTTPGKGTRFYIKKAKLHVVIPDV